MKKEINNIEHKITFKKMFLHFHTINKHKLKVFKLCLKCGLLWRGLVHDLSKYSPTEFFESARYFVGTHSPNAESKKDIGYSKAWLHHFGRNKHHHEYWYDYKSPIQTPIMPYKYVVEMICDDLSAGLTYQGKNWTNDYQYNYFMKRVDTLKMNDKIKDLLMCVFGEVKDKGIDKVLNKKKLKKLYNQYCGEK